MKCGLYVGFEAFRIQNNEFNHKLVLCLANSCEDPLFEPPYFIFYLADPLLTRQYAHKSHTNNTITNFPITTTYGKNPEKTIA